MLDLFYTVLIIWVLWKIFGGSRKVYVYHKNYYRNENPGAGQTAHPPVDQNKKNQSSVPDSVGEYIDFEEVK